MANELDPYTMLPVEESNIIDIGTVNPHPSFSKEKDLINYSAGVEQIKGDISSIPGGIPVGGYTGDGEYLPDQISMSDLFDPERLEQLRGRTQSNLSMLGNSMMQTVVGELIGGTIAGIGYITQMEGVSNYGEGIQEAIRTSNPVHGAWSPDDGIGERMTHLGWYMQNMPSMASTLSLMIPGLGATKALSMAGKALNYTAKLEKATKWASQLSKAGKAAKAAGDVTKAEKLLNTAKQVERLGTYAFQAGVQRIGENGMEGKQTNDEAYASAVRKLNERYSPEMEKEVADGYANSKLITQRGPEGNIVGGFQSFNNENEEAIRNKWSLRIDTEAKKIGNEAEAMNKNLNWLMFGQDFLQYALLGRVFGKGVKGAMAEYKIAKNAGRAYMPVVGKIGVAGAFDVASEGGEELYQFNSNAESIRSTEAKYGLLPDDIDSPTLGGRVGDRMGDPEAQTAGIWGMLGAGVFQAGGRGIKNLISKQEAKKKGIKWESETDKAIKGVEEWSNILFKSKKDLDGAAERGDENDFANFTDETMMNAAIKAKQSNTYNNLMDMMAALSSGKLSKDEQKAFGIGEEEVAGFAEIAKKYTKVADRAAKKYDALLNQTGSPMFAEILTRANFGIETSTNKIKEYKKQMAALEKELPGIDNLSTEDISLIQDREMANGLKRSIASLKKEFKKAKTPDERKAIKDQIDTLNKLHKVAKENVKDRKLETSVNLDSAAFSDYKALNDKVNENNALISYNQSFLKKYGSKANRSKISKALQSKNNDAFKSSVNSLTDVSQIEFLDKNIQLDEEKSKTLKDIVSSNSATQRNKAAAFDINEEVANTKLGDLLQNIQKALRLNDAEAVSKLLADINIEARKFNLGSDITINNLVDNNFRNKMIASLQYDVLIDNLTERYKESPHLQYTEMSKFESDSIEGVASYIIGKSAESDKFASETTAYFNKTDNSASPNTGEKSSTDKASDESKTSKETISTENEDSKKKKKEDSKKTKKRKLSRAAKKAKKKTENKEPKVKTVKKKTGINSKGKKTISIPVEEIKKDGLKEDQQDINTQTDENLIDSRDTEIKLISEFLSSITIKGVSKDTVKKITTLLEDGNTLAASKLYANLLYRATNDKGLDSDAMTYLELVTEYFSDNGYTILTSANTEFKYDDTKAYQYLKNTSDTIDSGIVENTVLGYPIVHNGEVVKKGKVTITTGTRIAQVEVSEVEQETKEETAKESSVDNVEVTVEADTTDDTALQEVLEAAPSSTRDNIFIKWIYPDANGNNVDLDYMANGIIELDTEIHLEVDYDALNNSYHLGMRSDESKFINNFAIQLVVYDVNGNRKVVGTLPPVSSKMDSNISEKVAPLRKHIYDTLVKGNTKTSGTEKSGYRTQLDPNRFGNADLNKTGIAVSLNEFSGISEFIFGVVIDDGIIEYNGADAGKKITIYNPNSVTKGSTYVLVPVPDDTFMAVSLTSRKLKSSQENFDALQESISKMLSENTESDLIIYEIKSVVGLSNSSEAKVLSLIKSKDISGLMNLISEFNMSLSLGSLNTGDNMDIVNSDIFRLNVNPSLMAKRRIIIKNQFFKEDNSTSDEFTASITGFNEQFEVGENDAIEWSEVDNADDNIDDLDNIDDEQGEPKNKMVQADETPNYDKTALNDELAWARRVMGNDVTIEVLNSLLNVDRSGGLKAWGVFRDSLVQYYKFSPIGTVRHEAFHAIFNIALSKGEQASILNKYTEEDLALKFETYVDSFGTEYSGLLGIIKKFFRSMYQMIKMRLTDSLSMDELFYRVHTGLYKDSFIKNYDSKASYNPKWKLEGLTDFENTEAVDMITYLFTRYVNEQLVPNPMYKGMKREDIIKKFGVSRIINAVVGKLRSHAKMLKPENGAKVELISRNIAYKTNSGAINYTNLGIAALNKLKKDEGVVLTIEPSGKQRINLYDTNEEALELHNEEQTTENWQVAADATSGKLKLSTKTRRALGNIPIFKKVGGKIMQDVSKFGIPKRIKFDTAYNNLKVALDNIIDEDHMISVLSEFIGNNPEYTGLLPELMNDKELRSDFFLDFNKAFTESIITTSRFDASTETYEYDIVRSNSNANMSGIKNQFIGGFEIIGLNKVDFDAIVETYNSNPNNIEVVKQILSSMGLGLNNSLITEKASSSFFSEVQKLVKMVSDGKELFSDKNTQSYAVITNAAKYLSLNIGEAKESSYVDVNNKLRYSHNNPNFLSDFVKKIKNKDSRDKWIAEKADDVFLRNSVWREELSRTNNKSFLDSFDFFMFNGVVDGKYATGNNSRDYQNMTQRDYTIAGINMYVNNYAVANKAGNSKEFFSGIAKYRAPVLSDATTSLGLMFKRYSNANTINNMFNMALQENSRINFMNKSKLDNKAMVSSGKMFVMLPFLNQHIDLFSDIKSNETEIKSIIENWLDTEVANEIAQMQKEGSYELVDSRFKNVLGKNSSKDELLKNYIYNSIFASSQIISLTIGDPAFYKVKTEESTYINKNGEEVAYDEIVDITDIFKRAKEIASPGIPLNVDAKYKGEGISKQYKAIYTEDVDFKLTTAAEKKIRKTFEGFGYTEGYINNIVRLFRSESTDGQTFITLDRYKTIMIGMQRWNHQLEVSFNNLKAGKETNVDILNITMNPIKPFFFSHTNYTELIDGKEEHMTIPTQIKNSEMVMLPKVFEKLSGTPLGAMYEQYFADNAKVKADALVYNSAIKVGGYNVATYKKGIWEAPMHILDNADYKYQQESPVHTVDYEIIFGTQIRKLVIANLPNNTAFEINGETLTKDELVNEYVSLIAENLKEASVKYSDLISDPNKLEHTIRTQILDDDLRSDMTMLTRRVNDTGTEEYIFPLSTQSMFQQMQRILLSRGRKRVLQQKISGAPLIQFSAIMFDNNLHVKYTKDGSIDYVEAMLPAYTMKMFGLKSGNKIKMDEIPDSLKYLLGFRIPTEDKSSIITIKVVGFLDAESGGAIAMAPEIIGLTGSDFDIDKFYVMTPKSRVIKDSKGFDMDKSIDALARAGINSTEKQLRDAFKTYKEWQKNRGQDGVDNNPAKYFESQGKSGLYNIYNQFRGIATELKSTQKIEKIEYDNSISASENGKAARDNRLIDIMRSIMRNGDIADIVLTPSSFETFKATVDTVNELRGANSSRVTNSITPRNNAVMMERNMTGSKLIGIGAVARIAAASIEDFNVTLSSPITIFGKETMRIGAKYTIKNDDIFGIATKLSESSEEYSDIDSTIESVSSLIDEIEGGNLVKSKDNKLLSDIENVYGEKFYTVTSRGQAEMSAAFVDNAKDPLSSFLNINMFTANSFELALMLGYEFKEVGMLFAQDIVSDVSTKYFNDNLSRAEIDGMIEDKLSELASNISGDIDSSGNVPVNQLENALKEFSNEEKTEAYYRTQYGTLVAFKRLNDAASDMFNKVKFLRSDNTKFLTSLAELENFVLGRKKSLLAEKNKKNPPLVIGMSDAITNSNTLANAFYEDGIKNIYDTLKAEFMELSDGFAGVKTLLSDFIGRNLSTDEITEVNESLKAYLFSEYSSRNLKISDSERVDLLANFPEELSKFKSDNADLVEENLMLKRLEVKPIKKPNTVTSKDGLVPLLISYSNFGSVTGTEIQDIVDDYNRLLTSPIAEYRAIGDKLYRYSLAVNNGIFTHASFSNLVPITYLSSLNSNNVNYAKFLRDVNRSVKSKLNNNIELDFVRKYLLHKTNSKIVPIVEDSDIKGSSEGYTIKAKSGSYIRFKLKDDSSLHTITINGRLTSPLVVKMGSLIYTKNSTFGSIYTLSSKLGYGKFINEYFMTTGSNSIIEANINDMLKNGHIKAAYAKMMSTGEIVPEVEYVEQAELSEETTVEDDTFVFDKEDTSYTTEIEALNITKEEWVKLSKEEKERIKKCN